ncbi:MFS transporter [Actinokineospora soli]|uniref:MFS transporter n=1 Tax=Actinokineospora soli TaxID=1048753 RepID=A0ABW2TMC7_9PSEU
MLVANLVRAGLLGALTLVVALGAGDVWVFYVIAVGVGVAETFHDIAAQSIVPAVVPDDRLPKANARLYAVELAANEFAGPPLAGLLVAAGAVVALAVPGGLWVAAVIALALVRGRFAATRRSEDRGGIVEGLRFLWRDRVLRAFAVVVGLFNFASSATYAVLVLYALGDMGLSETGFGWLLTTVAVGSVAGSVVAERVERVLGLRRALLVALVASVVLIAVPAATADPIAVGVAFFVGGAAVMVLNVAMVSLRQRLTPDALRGRVTSGHRLVAWGGKPLGALAGGVVAELLGLRAVFAVMALVALAAVPVLVRGLR